MRWASFSKNVRDVREDSPVKKLSDRMLVVKLDSSSVNSLSPASAKPSGSVSSTSVTV